MLLEANQKILLKVHFKAIIKIIYPLELAGRKIRNPKKSLIKLATLIFIKQNIKE